VGWSGGTWTARPPGGWSRSIAGPRASTPDRLGGRGIGVHSLRKTAINDAIRNGATLHEVREFAGHADIRTTEVYFVRKEEDAEVAARRIHIRVTGRTGK
jgi:integrase